jgi:hypothetical protein
MRRALLLKQRFALKVSRRANRVALSTQERAVRPLFEPATPKEET